jgi:hypothetical protein
MAPCVVCRVERGAVEYHDCVTVVDEGEARPLDSSRRGRHHGVLRGWIRDPVCLPGRSDDVLLMRRGRGQGRRARRRVSGMFAGRGAR